MTTPIEGIILKGLLSARPAAADALLYYATDTDLWYISDLSSWTALPAAVETHVHSGGDITSGTVADARIASTIARDSEITATKLDDFTAPDDNTDLNASTSAHGLLRKGDGDATHYLDGTLSWSTPAGGGGGGGITTVRGGVTSAGSVAKGTGFSVSRTAVGRYTITITSPFGSAPTVVLTGYSTGGVSTFVTLLDAGNPPTTSTIKVQCFSGGGAAFADQDFDFVAMAN